MSVDRPSMRSSSRCQSPASSSMMRIMRGDNTSERLARMFGNSVRRKRGPWAYHVDRASQRRDPYRAIACRLRRATLPRFWAQLGRSEDPHLPRLPAAKLQGGRRSGARFGDRGDVAARRPAVHASTESELLGFEGEAAARYFRLFDTMLRA